MYNFRTGISEIDDKLEIEKLPSLSDICNEDMPNHEIISEWLYKKCPPSPAGISVFTPSKLKEYSQSLTNNSNYRMKDPSGRCYDRALILAQELVALCYNPKLTKFVGESYAPQIKVNYNGKEITYDFHIVVTISDSLGDEYVLDPQFIDSAMKLKDYIEFISLPDSHEKLRRSDYHYLTAYLDYSDTEMSCQDLSKLVLRGAVAKINESKGNCERERGVCMRESKGVGAAERACHITYMNCKAWTSTVN